MATVVRRVNPSTHAAYQADDHLPVQVTALYARSARVPAAAGRELVRHTADRLAPAIRAMGGAAPDPLPGYRVKVLDGNHRGKTRRRIKPLRGGGRRAAAGAADGVSDYHLALEVSGACPGRWVAVPEETWEVIGGWSVGRMAGGLVGLARHANLRRYREATRGPKKPRPPRTRFAKAKHIATARPLNGEQAGP